jgi:tetraacyldisaccharide 4'-kinase
MTLRQRIWFGDGIGARAARVALVPLSTLYDGVITARNALYDRGLLSEEEVAIPTVSVGNLSVGGTGKTPVAAWMASELLARDARPAVVLRGYGGDEALVHTRLNPGVPVIVSPDRARGVERAADAGRDVAVLDDAFQHRRAARTEDVVLVSADRWREPLRTLPAGPWREGLAALERASLVIVTRKAAPPDEALALMRRLAPSTRSGDGAVLALPLGGLREVHGQRTLPVERMRGEDILVIAGVGDPDALEAQLRAARARADLAVFRDHHHFTSADVKRLYARAEGRQWVACTLKDAVKLQDLWPREGHRLWYFSQRVEVEHGSGVIAAMLQRLLDARRPTTPATAGRSRR